MNRNYRLIILCFSIFALLWGCGSTQKARKAESAVDSPAIHYERGKTLLDQGKMNPATEEFNQAKSLNPKYAPAYEGLAWIYFEKNNLKTAMDMADKSLGLDGHWVLAKIVKARVKAKQGKSQDAIKDLKNAIKDVPKSTVPDKKSALVLAWMSLGAVYQEADMYNEAQDAYSKVLAIDKTNMKADKAIKDLAAYKSAIAGQRSELRKIASQKVITRADVAVMFVSELPLQKIFREAPKSTQAGWRPPGESVMGKKKQPKTDAMPADVPANHWAKSFIREALEKGVLEVGPNGNFDPDQKVNRGEFARLIEKFLGRYWNDQSLETKFFGQTSPFFDVNNTSPIFNAIMTVSSRGVMPGFEDGSFNPTAAVSGTEALNIIRNLKSKL